MHKLDRTTAILGAALNAVACVSGPQIPVHLTREEIKATVGQLNAVQDGPQADGSVIVCTSGRTPESADSANQEEAKKALGVHAYQEMCGEPPSQEDRRAYTGGEERGVARTQIKKDYTIVCRRMAPPVQVICKDGQLKEYEGK